MITIYVNESPIEVPEKTNVLQLLEQIKSPTQGVAVALENKVLPTASWESYILESNSKVLIIQAAQGG